MPRIRQYAERDTMKDFVAEINAQCGRYGYKSQKSLGNALGVCQSTAGNYGGETNMICSNKVAGQTCDQDYMLVDYPTLIKRDGKNGFTASAVKEETTKVATETAYTQEQFVRDIQTACGAKVDGIAGMETLGKTVTLSSSKNRTHAAVKPVQQRLKALGFDPGNADGIYGSKTKAAVKAYQKANGCTQDGIITAGNKTWRKLLGM